MYNNYTGKNKNKKGQLIVRVSELCRMKVFYNDYPYQIFVEYINDTLNAYIVIGSKHINLKFK